MFNILDGRKHFYQWDLDRKLIVADKSIEEVHFSNSREGEALICNTYLQGDVLLVDVPNILLQDNWRIVAYAYDENYTKHQEDFEVIKRSKPADYVYTETEVKNYDDLMARIEQIEENGISDAAVEEAIEKYLEENDIRVDLTGYATEEYVQEQIENIDIPEVDLSDYAKKSEIPSTAGLASEKYVQEQIEKIPEPVDEVHVGANAPTDANVKIWVDTDAESPVATKEYVQQKVAEAQMGGDVDLSNYYTKTEVDAVIEQIELTPGEKGEKGDKGDKGDTGAQGEQGIQGEPGKDGKDGQDGAPGKDGVDGKDYVLTEADKQEIAGMVEVSGEDVDLSNYYTKEETTAAINEALNAIGIAEEVSF